MIPLWMCEWIDLRGSGATAQKYTRNSSIRSHTPNSRPCVWEQQQLSNHRAIATIKPFFVFSSSQWKWLLLHPSHKSNWYLYKSEQQSNEQLNRTPPNVLAEECEWTMHGDQCTYFRVHIETTSTNRCCFMVLCSKHWIINVRVFFRRT